MSQKKTKKCQDVNRELKKIININNKWFPNFLRKYL